MPDPGRTLLGVDFSCAPGPRKPITVAVGERRGSALRLRALHELRSLDAFSGFLQGAPPHGPASWLGGFDFPFGLPRLFVDALRQAPPASWPFTDGLDTPYPAAALCAALHAGCGDRQGLQRLIDGWGTDWGVGTRPARLPHRRADLSLPGLSSTSPLQTRYVPVGKMYFEGMPRLLAAGAHLPGLMPPADSPPPPRIALEAYPALLAHELLGPVSYKNDTPGSPTPERLLARLSLVDALVQGRSRLGVRLQVSDGVREQLAQDALGDRLDAVLCLIQAAWADAQDAGGVPRFGLPTDVDPVEGWILTA